MIPYKPVDCGVINTMVWETFRQSGIAISDRRHGSRSFRSSIASNMINDDVSTEIVRRVLGHGTKHAIKHYARIDIESMRLCPLPVPEPSGEFAKLLSWKVIPAEVVRSMESSTTAISFVEYTVGCGAFFFRCWISFE